MTIEEELDYRHLDEKSKAARIAAVVRQEQWHRHMQPFEALQALRSRLAISLLRERQALALLSNDLLSIQCIDAAV